jgi:hypothetical protein
MSRQKISLNTLSGPDSRDLSVRYPADRIRVSAWFCQNLSEVPACYLGITRGRVRPFYLLVLSLYGFTTLYTNPFLIIYLLPHFKLPVLVLFWGLKQKKTKFGFPHYPFFNCESPREQPNCSHPKFLWQYIFFYSRSVHSGIQPLPLKIF